MKQRELLPVGAPPLSFRLARFEDVSEILRLIERALDHGCRDVYDERQRRAVYLGYASSLFIEALGPCETLVAKMGGCLVGATQVDPRTGLLRALFVDAGFQGQGVGHALLTAIESRARAAHCKRLCGAMSLNAVAFYRRAGFRARGGPEGLRGAPTWVPVQWMEKPLSANVAVTMLPVVDSHCHLDFEDFHEDLPAVLERARAAGIVAMVCVGSGGDLATAERAAALATQEHDVFAAVGIHPHDAGKIQPDFWPALEKLAKAPRVVGIGETGLDYFYDHSPRQVQREVFTRFLALATSANLPVICHVRDAHDDAIEILRAGPIPTAGGVLHCFSGTVEHARSYLDLGLHLSFSGVITFKKAEELRKAAAFAPADRIMVETDSPYLAPVPHRGRRNEPAFVLQTLETVAQVRGIPLDQAAEATTANAFRLFQMKLAQPVG